MGIAVVMYVVFALGLAAFVAVVAVGFVNRRRGRDTGEWQDDPADGDVTMRPGVGWGNGGSWS